MSLGVKKILIAQFLLCYMYSFSQNEIIYKKTLSDIKKSQNILCTGFIIPNEDFFVGIYPINWDVEDLTKEQCGDIKTDSIKNNKIIETLEKKRLLDKLYINIENNQYSCINSSETFQWEEASLIIDLDFFNEQNIVNQVYIPIWSKKDAKEIIKLISEIFNSEYCFRKLKRKL